MLITVNANPYLVPSHYSPGPHDLTPAEAHVLDRARAQGITSAASKWPRPHTPDEIAQFQGQILEYASAYSLDQSPNGGKPRQPDVSPLERELESVAREWALQSPDYDEGALDEMIESAVRAPDCQIEARRRLAIKQRSVSPEDLGL